MTTKSRNIINWVLAGLVGLIFIGSGLGKIFAGDQAIQMAKDLGITAETVTVLAIIEIVLGLLFIYPRTGISGTLLLAAYMGGAIATHLQQGQPLIAPCLIEAFVWIAAMVRFPELSSRLLDRK